MQRRPLPTSLRSFGEGRSLQGEANLAEFYLPLTQGNIIEVLWGERDRVLPHSQAHDAVTRLPNGSLELIPNCGHLPQVEHPERFASSLARFLGERPERWT